MSNKIDSVNNMAIDTLKHFNNNLSNSINSTQKIVESANSNNIAIYLAAFAILLCFVLVIILILERKNYRDKIIDVVLTSSRISQFISKEKPSNNISRASSSSFEHQMSEAEIKQYIIKSIELNKDRDINAIVDRVLECLHKDNNSLQQKNVEIKDPTVKKPIANLLYATPADDNAVFENTSNEITEDSFFILTINQNQKTADFSLIDNDKVTTKIIKVNDYLITSCEKIGSGTTRITTTNKGKAELQSNGKWKVITKAKVKFE